MARCRAGPKKEIDMVGKVEREENGSLRGTLVTSSDASPCTCPVEFGNAIEHRACSWSVSQCRGRANRSEQFDTDHATSMTDRAQPEGNAGQLLVTVAIILL
jgi:hypothetical protein